jgi:signal transduction histidine kinase
MQKVRDLSLVAAIDARRSGPPADLFWMFERFSADAVKVQFEHQGMEERFHAEVGTAAYRIVQEALTNVARHSGVGVVDVHARCDGAVLGLQIEDTGQGFDPGLSRVARLRQVCASAWRCSAARC